MTNTASPTPASHARPLTSDVVVAADDGLHLPGTAERLLAGHKVTAIADDADALWAVVDRRELHHIVGGDSRCVAVLESGTTTCLHVHRGRVYLGGDDATLLAFDGDAIVRVASFDQAPTRSDWYTPWGGPPSVFTMTSHGDDLYVSVHVGGILHSSDGAQTWRDTIDLETDVHQVAIDHRDGTVWAAMGDGGLAESRDRGTTWVHHTEGLLGTYLLAVAVSSAGILVSGSSGHAATDSALHLFDGTMFHQITNGLPADLGGGVGPRHLAASGSRAALSTHEGDVHTSDDGGLSWSLLDRHAGIHEVAIFPEPADSSTGL